MSGMREELVLVLGKAFDVAEEGQGTAGQLSVAGGEDGGMAITYLPIVGEDAAAVLSGEVMGILRTQGIQATYVGGTVPPHVAV